MIMTWMITIMMLSRRIERMTTIHGGRSFKEDDDGEVDIDDDEEDGGRKRWTIERLAVMIMGMRRRRMERMATIHGGGADGPRGDDDLRILGLLGLLG